MLYDDYNKWLKWTKQQRTPRLSVKTSGDERTYRRHVERPDRKERTWRSDVTRKAWNAFPNMVKAMAAQIRARIYHIYRFIVF